MRTLLTTIETFRVDTEAEAMRLIEEAKDLSNPWALVKYSNQHKEKKQKGEIVDSYFKVTLTKKYDEESV